ncbi:MAG TPA: hypothetical protein DCG28_06870, partial [Lachnospiraceae bacterium]|nr:hypothetical protein [Lachnospiraceae bacterium]
YNVTAIDTWTGNKSQKTRIYVREDGMGQDVAQFFSDAEIITDPEFSKEHDLTVIIGLGEFLNADGSGGAYNQDYYEGY